MEHLTKEQIKEFWEEYGFFIEDMKGAKIWCYKDGEHYIWRADHLPGPDLNNLFKYAPTSIQSITITETKWADGSIWTQCYIIKDLVRIYGREVSGKMKDVANLALFWALHS